MDNNDKSNFDELGRRIYGYPVDAKQWWDLVDVRWESLMDIVFHHMSCSAQAYEVPGNAASKPTGRTIWEELEYLREKRDMRLSDYFHAAWGMASDAYAWSVPHWGALCNLCSESNNCLYEECDGPPSDIMSGEECKKELETPSSSQLDW